MPTSISARKTRRGWTGETSRNSRAWLFGSCVSRQPTSAPPSRMPRTSTSCPTTESVAGVAVLRCRESQTREDQHVSGDDAAKRQVADGCPHRGGEEGSEHGQHSRAVARQSVAGMRNPALTAVAGGRLAFPPDPLPQARALASTRTFLDRGGIEVPTPGWRRQSDFTVSCVGMTRGRVR